MAVWPTDLRALYQIWRRINSPGGDAELLRRSRWNYPRLEKSAAPIRNGAIQNRIGFDDHISVLQQSYAESTAGAKPLCHPTLRNTQLGTAQLTSERVESKIVCRVEAAEIVPCCTTLHVKFLFTDAR